METAKKDIYQRITDTIVGAIEQGTSAYKMPWRTVGGLANSPINAISRRPYRGVNILVLWALSLKRNYKSGTWATYKQWKELGAQVRKGEKSANVVFWKFLEKEHSTDDETTSRRVPMARDYWVFNADQVEGYQPPELMKETITERIESAESFFTHLGIVPKPGGNEAYYSADSDSIHMPAFEAFKEPLLYYSVLSHETTHWTGPKHRLDRDLSGRFGSESYAMEELIAELGSAFLCGELQLPTDPRQDHAPYISSWLRVLKNDKRAIFTAAAKAQQAVDFMLQHAGKEVSDEL